MLNAAEHTQAEVDPGPFPPRVRRWLGICVDGWPFVVISLGLTLLMWRIAGTIVSLPFWLITGWVAWFFRDPQRQPPADINAIVSPADGKVIDIQRVQYPRLLTGEAMRVSIFMSIFNVHVNRIPFSGTIRETSYNSGKFLCASSDKASLDNEQMAIVIDTARGVPILFVQIAGLIARRIICRLKTGEIVQRGERFGLIRFGSRCDVYLPPAVQVSVKLGDVVQSGSSVLGKF